MSAPPTRGSRCAPLLKRVVLGILPPAFRSEHGEDLWRSLKDECFDARERSLPGSLLAVGSAFVDVGVTALVEWGVAIGRSVPRRAHLPQDLRWAFRNVRRRPGLSTAIILVMAVGIGSAGTVFSVVNGVLLQPMGDDDRVVHLIATKDREPIEAFSHNNLQDLFTRATQLEQTAMRDLWAPTLTLDRPVRLRGAIVGPRYFDVFAASPSRGRFFATDDTGVLVVSHGFWTSALGSDPDVIGATLPLNGNSIPVIGVAGPEFVDPWGAVDVWLLMPDAYHVDDRSSAFLLGIGRLTEQADLEVAAAEISAIGRDLATEFPEVNSGFGIEAVTPKSRLLADTPPVILSFMGAGLLLLILACANVSTLLLGRAVERRSEMAVRAALGARMSRQLQQLLTESLVLAALAGALGALGAWAGTRGLASIGEASLPRADEIALDPTVLVFLVVVSLATGIVFGVLPALHAAGSHMSLTLRTGGRSGLDHQGRWIRDILIGTQMTLVVMLLVGAGLLLRSAHELSAVDPGFEPENAYAFSVSVPPSSYPEAYQVEVFRSDLLTSLAASPGVESAGMINILPLIGRIQGFPFELDHRPTADSQTLTAQLRVVSHGYAQAAGIDMVEGRWFTQRDRVDEPLALVASRAFSERYLNDVDPIRATVTVFGESHQIVGVVDDVREDRLAGSPRPSLYLVDTQTRHAPDWLVRNLSTVVRSTLPAPVIAEAVRESLATIDGTLPVHDFQTMEGVVESQLTGPRFRATLAGSMAGVALFMALFGVAAAMAYSAEQQTREVGIRLAVGGSPQRVVSQMVGGSARVILVGVSAGIVGAAATTRALSGFLYSVQPLDTLTFLTVVGGVAVTAVVASLVPAARVVGRGPLAAIESE